MEDECKDITRPESREYEKKLEKMSPFEVKGTLINMAELDARCSTATFLNAGRGNPDWIMANPREAFFAMGRFAMQEARLAGVFFDGMGVVSSPKQDGVAKRFEAYLEANKDDHAVKILREIYDYATKELGADPDEVVFEWVDGITGDHYPTPPRILKYTELICRKYVGWAMGGDGDDRVYDLFATEGSTAGMCYAFETLKQNFLMRKGDKMALLVPAFTPYIEIPQLQQFGWELVLVSANKVEKNGYHDWQYPPEEIDKLRDPAVKAVCVTNPSNPPSYMLAPAVLDQIKDVVEKDNPDLMIISDDVYGTFVKGFKSLMYALPYNTLCLYSFSKYFGATGWRIATMCLPEKNVFDDRLKKLSDEEKAALDKRYGSLTINPSEIKFIDRLVADSRLVGLNHTAGLSCPQQVMMSFFAAYGYMHRDIMQPDMIGIIHKRLDNLWKTTGFTLQPDPLRAGYYSEIDIMVWAKKFYGDDFADYLAKNYEPLDFVIRLAKETAVVLLNGDGFDGPAWSVRASLANLDDEAYLKIGASIRNILDEYHARYLAAKK